MDILRQIQHLRTKINRHNIRYHVHDDPIISDSEYDELMKELLRLEKENPKLSTSDSPTQRVGAKPLSEFQSITHKIPMLSLANAMNIEELEEFKEAIKNNDLKEVADALTDILYVTYGAGHAFGINLDKCFEEVQQSNMSKLSEDGKPIYNEAGKVMKGPKYFKPDLNKFLK